MTDRVARFLDQIISDIHNRTPRDLIINENVLLVGAGGIGTWTALALTLSAGPNFRMLIVDDDVLEAHNLNRLPFPVTEALRREKKAVVLQRYLKWLRPWLDIRYAIDRIDTVEKAVAYARVASATIIVDAVDNPRSIRLLKGAARRVGAHYLGLHYDGTSVTIEWTPAGQNDTDWVVDEEAAGYRVFPSCAFVPMFAASIAALIVAVKPERLFLSCDLRDSIGGQTG